MTFAAKGGEAAVIWPGRAESPRWGVGEGGYVRAGIIRSHQYPKPCLGIRALQRFAQWGTAALGEQKELIARFELEARPVKTAGWFHLELVSPPEARLLMLNFKVWDGWNVFLTVNLGTRYTKAAQMVRAKQMTQRMADQARREQAARARASSVVARFNRQQSGRPWPPRAK